MADKSQKPNLSLAKPAGKSKEELRALAKKLFNKLKSSTER